MKIFSLALSATIGLGSCGGSDPRSRPDSPEGFGVGFGDAKSVEGVDIPVVGVQSVGSTVARL